MLRFSYSFLVGAVSFYIYSVTLLISPLHMCKCMVVQKLLQNIQQLMLSYVCVSRTKVILRLLVIGTEGGTRTPTIITISGF